MTCKFFVPKNNTQEEKDAAFTAATAWAMARVHVQPQEQPQEQAADAAASSNDAAQG